MHYLKTDRLYCFSPPVMLATLIIEIVCAIYVVARYKMTPVTRLAAAVLVCLAVFQLAEYNVCEGAWGVDSLTWARIGCVAISLLPPLGVHLAAKIAGQKQPWLIGAGYVSGLIFAGIFLLVGHGMESDVCLGNYVIFSLASWVVAPYSIYYYGWLLITVGYAWRMGRFIKKRSQKTALYALAIGYLAFIIPTTAAMIVDSAATAAIPSVMCGFAVILALVLTGVVMPRYHSR